MTFTFCVNMPNIQTMQGALSGLQQMPHSLTMGDTERGPSDTFLRYACLSTSLGFVSMTLCNQDGKALHLTGAKLPVTLMTDLWSRCMVPFREKGRDENDVITGLLIEHRYLLI